jgi:hypothetical protein
LNRAKPWFRRRGILSLATIAALAIGMAIALPASALDTSVFELDGNAVTDHAGTGLPDDWDRVCHSVLGTDCSTTNNANTSVVEFASQTVANGTAFSGGGSKDPIDISSWAYTIGIGGLPGKDALLNGFAARYTTAANASCTSSTATCSEIFFGMDRFDNSGDAQNGFWFLQNAITLGSTKSGAGFNFNGVHKNGDLLVVSDFSVGGTTSTISVFLWNNTCTAAGKPVATCADANLQLLQTSTFANCATSAPNASFCGIVNPANGTTVPWPTLFMDKSGNTTTFQAGEFYEGGINLSAFPGLANECFASTLAESRSSTSTSATLKSFVLGGFGACGSKTVTHPLDSSGTDISGGSVPIGAGSVQVKDQAVVTVTGTSSYDGTVTFHLCSPDDLATLGEPTCIAGGTLITVLGANSGTVSPPSPSTVTSDLATITKAGNYCWRAEYSGDAAVGVPPSSDASSTECFTVTPVTPTLVTSATIAGTPSGTTNLPATITDTATLSGTANEPGSPVINPTTQGSAAKGTITFTAFGPSGCSSTAVFTQTVNVNGNSSATNIYSASFSPNAPGTYTFVASYSGDSPNTNPSTVVACANEPPGESVTATDTSSATSAQTWVPNDTATVVSGSTKGDLNGTLTLQLFDGSSSCGGTAVQTYGPQTVTNASTATISSNNSTFKVSVSDSVSWLVTFSSSDPNVAGTSHCENTSLTINN